VSPPIFDREYAEQYDVLYGAKNYAAECDLIEGAIARYSRRPVDTVLDLGCGTGGHALPLAQRGYRVTGVDRSAAMLAHAVRKAAGSVDTADRRPAFVAGDLRTIALGGTFDAAVMMFAVLGYQLTDEDVRATLRNVRAHLRRRGLFIFDVWHGPAVLAIGPSDTVKTFANTGGTFRRVASGVLDSARHT
jgi:SAM-dependent methyltransferase